jgi:hypothetical protein
MIADLTLSVELRGPDPAALTAQHALAHRLGYGAALAETRRVDLWRLDVEAAGIADALAIAGSWITRSNLFVNPNKHVYELAAGRGTNGAVGSGGGGRGKGRVAWVVATSEPDLEGEAAVELIHRRFQGLELRSARRAVAWKVHFAQAVEPSKVLELASEMAVARSRMQGLLTNPHFQSVVVVRAGSAAQAAAEVWS